MKNEDIIKVENLRNKDDTFTIRWNMTKICNYHCDFCVQGNKEKHLSDSKGESAKIRKQICNKIIYFIENKLNNKFSRIKIFLIGGEITILKDFLDILEKFMNCQFEGEIVIYITTNLSASESVYKEVKRLALSKKDSKYPRKLSITASFYKTFTTEEEFIKKIKILHVEKALKLFLVSKKDFFKNKKIYSFIENLEKSMSNISICIGYPLVTDDDYEEYVKFKRRNFFNANIIKHIVIRNFNKSISQQLKKKLSKNKFKLVKVTLKDNKVHYFSNTAEIGFEIEDTKHFNPNGLICDSGVYNISISNKGIISRCPSCSSKTVVGNILNGDIELSNEKFNCPSMSCNCDYYKMIERIQNK
jgi:MoaA/NifB/PqqE/SkfB family radical SAM enzyme